MFNGPCIANFFPKYNQQDATLHSLFIPVNCSTCFRWILTHHQKHKTVFSALVFVKPLLLPAAIVEELSLNTSTIAAHSSNRLTNTRCCRYSCMCSWWLVGIHPKHVEQFTEINKLCNFASCWFYSGGGIRHISPQNFLIVFSLLSSYMCG